jgi:hypothetical protein
MSRSKDIGTRGESAVVRFARANGFPEAERQPPRGVNDQGDIVLCRGVIVEVKAGQEAKAASRNLIDAWWGETERERQLAGADVGVLVVQHRGYGTGRPEGWDAYLDLHHLTPGPTGGPFSDGTVVCLPLANALDLLTHLLYGDPTNP